jgi:hypothetical protein
MNATALLDACRAVGVMLQVDGDNLVVETDRDPPPDLIAELRAHKRELIAVLSPQVAADVVDDPHERASIIEYDGKIPRAWAVGAARLDPDRPPGDVLLKRWQRFVDDVGVFLDSSFCAVAAALGWGPLDLFGCDRDRPFARIDQSGLLWLLNGARLVALTETTAAIEAQTGARLTYRRKPNQAGRVLAWELAP